ncbi:MAG: DNRLRE domain-containing protein, partial [Chloroflexi bacterium]
MKENLNASRLAALAVLIACGIAALVALSASVARVDAVPALPTGAPLPPLPIDPSVPVPVPSALTPAPPPALPIDPSVPIPAPTPPVDSPVPVPTPALPTDPSLPAPLPAPPGSAPLPTPAPLPPAGITPPTAPNQIDPSQPVKPLVAPDAKPSQKPSPQGALISPGSPPSVAKQTHTSAPDNHSYAAPKTSRGHGQTARSGRAISPTSGLDNNAAAQPVLQESSGGSLNPLIANGDGLFDPTAFPDSILAILGGLLALLGVAYWLQEQRRRDRRLVKPATGLQRLASNQSANSHVQGESHANGHREHIADTNGGARPGGAAKTHGFPLHANGNSAAFVAGSGMISGHVAGAIATAERGQEAKPQADGRPVNGALTHSPLAGTVPLATRHNRASAKAAPPTPALVSVVIPAKNEEKSLPYVLRRLPPWLHEVIVVDGLSEDATSEVARLCLPSVRVVSQSGRGKGNALREGFVHCTGDIVIALDADGSMDPGEIPAIVTFLESGLDYVKGSRMIAGGSSVDLTSFRRFGNWMLRTLTNFLNGTSYTDLCYGYFGFRRGTVDRLDLHSSGFEIETEISIKAHHAGLRTAEIPSSESVRHNGASNLSALRDGWRILRTIVQAATEDSIPAHSHMGAVAMIGLGLGALIALGAMALPQDAANVAGMDATQAVAPAPAAAAALLSPVTLNPIDDAYVAGELPNDNFGSDPLLEADASPVRESYLKFDLRPLASQGVSQAIIRMYVTNGSGGTVDLKDVSDSTWTEGAITFNNKPAKGSTLASFNPGTTTGRWLEVDITSATAGKAGSFMSVALQTSSTDALGFNSAEALSNRVELVVQPLGATPGPSGTATATPLVTTAPPPTPTPSAAQTSAATAVPGTTTLNPVDDAYVAGDLPADNFGSDPSLSVDASPVRESYIKFDLRPFAGQSVSKATLRMFVTNGSGGAVNLNAVSDSTWTEGSITFGNKPAKGAVLKTFTPGTTTSVWLQIDVTSAVASKAGSLMSAALDTTSSDGFAFNSSESANNRVELVVQTVGSQTPGLTASPTRTPTSATSTPTKAPTATPTRAVTPTPTRTATATPTRTPTATPTPAAVGTPFSFGVAGDLGANSNSSAVFNAAHSAGLNFFLPIGDFSYSDVTPESSWCNFVKQRMGSSFPVELISGNHEDDGPDGQIAKFAACLPDQLGGLSGTYSKEYYFDYPAGRPLARFINISPNLSFPGQGTYSYTAGSSHYNWTASAIDQARARGIKWVVVSMHEYCITLVSASCSIGPDITNLLINKKVDLVLQAHDHAFNRSKQLALRTGCSRVNPGSYDPDCVVDTGSDGSYGKGAGTVILTVGVGGKSINSVDTRDAEAPYFTRWMGSNANP